MKNPNKCLGYVWLCKRSQNNHPWSLKQNWNTLWRGGVISWLSAFNCYLPYSTVLVKLSYLSPPGALLLPREGTNTVPREYPGLGDKHRTKGQCIQRRETPMKPGLLQVFTNSKTEYGLCQFKFWLWLNNLDNLRSDLPSTSQKLQ